MLFVSNENRTHHITELIAKLHIARGEERSEIERVLYDAYAKKIHAIAAEKLFNAARKAGFQSKAIADDAFVSFFKRPPTLRDRNELVAHLIALVARNALDAYDHATAQKRDVRRNVSGDAGDDVLVGPFDVRPPPRRPASLKRDYHKADPEAPACVPEQGVNPFDDELELRAAYDELLEPVKDPILRQIALLRVAGYTVSEIANVMEVSIKTIRRKLKEISEILGLRPDEL